MACGDVRTVAVQYYQRLESLKIKKLKAFCVKLSDMYSSQLNKAYVRLVFSIPNGFLYLLHIRPCKYKYLIFHSVGACGSHLKDPLGSLDSTI